MIPSFNHHIESMKSLTLLLIVCSIIFTGCNLSPCGFSKDQFVEKHLDLVNQAKKNKKSWKDTDWESRDGQMKQMVEECYENYEEEMSDKEIAKFWTGTATYYFNRHGKGFLKAIKSSERDISKALEKGLKSLDDNKEGLLKDWLNDNLGDDIEKTFDELGKKLKSGWRNNLCRFNGLSVICG